MPCFRDLSINLLKNESYDGNSQIPQRTVRTVVSRSAKKSTPNLGSSERGNEIFDIPSAPHRCFFLRAGRPTRPRRKAWFVITQARKIILMAKKTLLYFKKLLRLIHRKLQPQCYRSKLETWESWFADLSQNPFRVEPGRYRQSDYKAIAERTIAVDDSILKGDIELEFGCLPDEKFIESLARQTQFIPRPEFTPGVHLHGDLLYGALRKCRTL